MGDGATAVAGLIGVGGSIGAGTSRGDGVASDAGIGVGVVRTGVLLGPGNGAGVSTATGTTDSVVGAAETDGPTVEVPVLAPPGAACWAATVATESTEQIKT